jgi:TatD DNase family protein
MFDSHCHLFDPPLRDDPEGVLVEAREEGCTGVLVVATWASAWEEIVESRERIRSVLPDSRVAAGLHPWYVHEAPEDWEGRLRGLFPRLDAVGEIGLDRGDRAPEMALQEPVFARQLQLAAEAGLPVLIHVVRAHELVLHHLKEVRGGVRGIIHAFSGSPEDARAYINRGFLLGIGGGLTRENAHRLRRVVSTIPLESLVLETDSPYLGTGTVPAGASRPAHVRQVAQRLAEVLGVPIESVVRATTANLKGLWERT